MGMFDTIKDKIFCPYCGKLSEENEYQTKDIECMLDRWEIKDLIEFGKSLMTVHFYSECRYCGKWVEIILHTDTEHDKLKE